MSNVIWRRPDTQITKECIKKIEGNLDIKFPSDYIECAIYNHGASVTPYKINVGRRRRVFGELLSYDENSSSYIMGVNKILKGRLLEGIIPFASDPAGNYFCFDYRKDEKNPQIVFFSSEQAVGEEDYSKEELQTLDLIKIQEEAIEYVCGSFSELLERLF